MLRHVAAKAGSRICSFSHGFHTTASDTIQLKGLVFHGFHGVLEEEKSLGQKFLVDATLYTCLHKPGKSDDLKDTIDYAQIYRKIQSIVEGRPFNLIEALADRIAVEILESDGRIECAKVSVRKPHVAVSGVLDSLGIEIVRTRDS